MRSERSRPHVNPIVFAIPVFMLTSRHLGVVSQVTGLFSTFADERDDRKIIYGARKPLRSLHPLWAYLHYYADLWQATLCRNSPCWYHACRI